MSRPNPLLHGASWTAHPWLMVKFLPVALVGAVLGLLAFIAGERAGLPAGAQAALAWVVVASLAGKRALRARGYEPDLWPEVVGWLGRYVLLTTLWSIPFVWVLHRWVLDRAFLNLNPTAPGGTRTWALGGFLFAVWIAATVLIAALATRVTSIWQLATLKVWTALLRRHDRWRMALVGTLGGGLVYFFLTMPVLMGLGLIASKVGVVPSVSIRLAAFLLPMCAVVILSVQLGGALAAEEPSSEVAEASDEVAAPGDEPSIPASYPRPEGPQPVAAPTSSLPKDLPTSHDIPGAGALELIKQIKRLRETAETDLEGAIATGESMEREHPRSAGLIAELALLYRQDGRTDLAHRTAAKAITLATHGGMGPVAVDTYVAFEADRDALNLPAEVKDQLGKILRAHGNVPGARWCFGYDTSDPNSDQDT